MTVGAEIPAAVTPRSTLWRVGLALSLCVLVLGSLHFARYDWTGLPLDRAPVTAERRISPDCLEHIRPYVTESGRVIKPVVVDEQQYLALVQYYRGTPVSDLQVSCLYDPFTFRSGTSWIAHFLPFEEGLALGLTNTAMLILAVWLMLFTLRAQRASPRVVLAAGAMFTIAWNTLFFGTAVLVDSGVLAALCLSWYLLAKNKPWLVLPVLFLGYPLKETMGIFVPVFLAWAWKEYREGRRSLVSAAAPAVAGAAVFVFGVAFWRQVMPESSAAWPVTPGFDLVEHNLGAVLSLVTFAIGVGPLLVPSVLRYRRMAVSDGWFKALTNPAVVGVIMALGICFWSFITVDLTPRLFWIGFPFATTLTAEWFSEGRPADWLAKLRIPPWLLPSAGKPSEPATS